MYAGGSIEAVLELLDPDIVWHVPGSSPIAGDHRGRDGVARYFERRRARVSATMRMHPGEVMADEDAVAQFVRGSAEVDGEAVEWHTVGAYRIEAGRIAEVWLVPLDLAAFERVWNR